MVLLLSLGCSVAEGDSLSRTAVNPTTAPAVPSIARILANVRKAVGYTQLARYENGLLIREVLKQKNHEIKCSLLFTPEGKYVERYEGGMTQALGFDGAKRWLVDYSGEPQVLDETEYPQLRDYHLTTWLRTGYWLAHQDGIELSIVKGHTNTQRVTVSARLAGSATEQWILVDRSTWLPTAICEPNLSDAPLWRFEDYRSTLGFRLPHRLVAQSSGQVSCTILIRKVEQAPRAERHSYAAPKARDSARFISNLSPKVDFRLAESGLLLVRPRIDNQPAGWFLFDSGTNFTIVFPEIADKLNMTAGEKFPGELSGNSILVPLVQASQLQVARLVVSKPTFLELPAISFMKSIDADISGILGYDVFRRAVIELDISKASLKLYDPETYRAEDVDWQELFFDNRLICVRCRFEGDRDALFMIDTGSNETVSFSAPTVEHFKLLDGRETKPLIVMDQDRYIGTGREGTIAWFEIAGHRIDNPEAVFSPSEPGEKPYDPSRRAGAIGLGLLRHFKVIFDYPHKRIAFVKLDDKRPARPPTAGKADRERETPK